MQEGELLKIKAEQAIIEEEEAEREKRNRAMKNNIELNRINEDNKRLKEI